MADSIAQAYRLSKDVYDDVLTQNTWWSRLYIRLIWGGVDDNEIARKLLLRIPEGFSGRLLDVPVGTGVFTSAKYEKLPAASITCLDYSSDMLEKAQQRFAQAGLKNVSLQQGDVGALPFSDGEFDMVLSMNGFHAFPQKDKAFLEIHRVLGEGGSFLACFYIRGCSRVTDVWVNSVLSRRGWFTPPFHTVDEVEGLLRGLYRTVDLNVEGSMVSLCCLK